MVSRPLIEGINAAALAVFADGNRLAVAVNDERDENQRPSVSVEIWELGEKRKVRRLTGLTGSYPSTVAVSPDGRRVAAASADDRFYHSGENADTRVLLWDADSGEQVMALSGSVNGHRCVAFSPDGRTVAAGGEDHAAHIWELATGRSANVFTSRLCATAFLPQSLDLESPPSIGCHQAQVGQSQYASNAHEIQQVAVAFDNECQAQYSTD